jgi:hypothetical protein
MALAGYVITAPVTIPAGTPATVAAGEPGPAGWRGGGVGISAGYAAFPQCFQAGTPIFRRMSGSTRVHHGPPDQAR